MDPEHLLELAPQMARDEMQRLLVHRAAFDRIDRQRLLEAALHALDQRAFTGADRAHQVENLAALLALERGGMEKADYLGDRFFNSEELIGEEVEDLHRLVLMQPLGARVIGILHIAHAHRHNHVVDSRVGKLGDGRVGFDHLEVFEQGSFPARGLTRRAVFFDHLFEVAIRHPLTPKPKKLWALGKGS